MQFRRRPARESTIQPLATRTSNRADPEAGASRSATAWSPRSLSPAADREALHATLSLAAIGLAEGVTRAGLPGLGVALYAMTLTVGINWAAAAAGSKGVLGLGIAMVAIERLLSVALPFPTLGPPTWYITVAVPTLVGIALVAQLARYSRGELRLVVDGWAAFISLLTIAPGLAVGFAYYRIARPLAIVDERGSADLVVSTVAVAIAAALVEEILFRGLLQRAASRLLGPVLGVVFVAVLYTLLAAPWSAMGIGAVFASALWFAALTIFSGSIVPAVVAHASVNVGLLLVAAFSAP